MKVQITVEIEQEIIDDLLSTAYEGGSTFWATLSEDAEKIIENACPEKDNPELAPSEQFIEAIKKSCIIPINDAENPEDVLGFISTQSIEKALTTMATKRPQDISDIINGDWDADIADIFFQYAVMGEIVFG